MNGKTIAVVDLALLGKYATQLGTITELAVNNSAESKAENAKRDERKGGLVDAVKDFATVTHADGVAPEAAAVAMRIAMQNVVDEAGKPVIAGGTVKGYTAAFRGYRKILARGETIADVNSAKAQEEVASDEAKAIKAAKAAFAKHAAKWTAKEWTAFVASLASDESGDGEDEGVTDDEVGELESEAKVANG